MTITLRPEQEKLIAQAIETGAYQNPDEVIERALRILHCEEEWLLDHKAEISEKIERAFGQFDRGEFFSADESKASFPNCSGRWDGCQVRDIRAKTSPSAQSCSFHCTRS